MTLAPITAARDGAFELPADGFVQVMPFGEWPGVVEFGKEPPAGLQNVCKDGEGHTFLPIVQVLDRSSAEAIVAGFRPDMLLDYDHFAEDPDSATRAAGWGEELQIRDDGLYCRVRWTADGLKDVAGGNYRFISPVFPFAALRNVGGNRWRPTAMSGAALTNKPRLKGIRAVSNRAAAILNGTTDANGMEHGEDDGKFVGDGQGGEGGSGVREVESADEVIREAKSSGAKAIVRLGKTTEDEVRRIKAATDFDATGYEHVLTADAVRHVRKHHPEITDDMLKNYRSLAASAEDIAPSKTDDGLPAIEYRKRINGDLLVIQERRDKKKHLALTTMKKVKAGVARADSRQPLPYVLNGPGDTTIIAPSGSIVNTMTAPCGGHQEEGQPAGAGAGTAADSAGAERMRIMREQLIQALGLPPEATDEDIVAAVAKLNGRVSEIEQKQLEAQVENDLKEHEAKIVNRDAMKAALLKDRAGTLAVLAGVKAPEAGAVLNRQDGQPPRQDATVTEPDPGAIAARNRYVEEVRVSNRLATRAEAWPIAARQKPELFR